MRMGGEVIDTAHSFPKYVTHDVIEPYFRHGSGGSLYNVTFLFKNKDSIILLKFPFGTHRRRKKTKMGIKKEDFKVFFNGLVIKYEINFHRLDPSV